MKLGAKYLGGALLAALLLWIVFRGVDPRDVALALGRASIAGLVVCGLLNLGHNAFRAWRWGLLLRPVRATLPFRSRIAAIVLGYLTTWTIPGRLGELVRPALLAAKERVPIGPCVGTVVADRILDGVAIVILFALGTVLAPPVASAGDYAAHVGELAWILMIGLLLLLAALLTVAAQRARLTAWVQRRRGPIRFTGNAVLSLVEGIEALRRPRLVLPILAHSLLAWLTIAFGTWIGIRATGVVIPFGAVLVLLPPLALGVALPTPGGAGGYHAAMKLGLQHLYGVPEAAALSAGILVHLTVTIPVIVAGLLLLRTEGVSFGGLRELVRDARRPAVGSDAAAPLQRQAEAAS